MLRILSWNSNLDFDKMQSHDLQLVGQETRSPAPTSANVPIKRKRSFDAAIASPMDAHEVKAPTDTMTKMHLDAEHSINGSDARRPQNGVDPSVSHPEVPVLDNTNDTVMESEHLSRDVVKSKEEAQLATMRQTISSQLSLEILLKHQELRLIDQELAKCQIALEQLRRCSEIPYPALQQPSDQVTTGRGAALRKSSERFPAKSPAPWGVTDGPYSRHYAKWLLPHPQFDGGEPEPVNSSVSISGRSTRGHFTDFAQMVGKTSRSQRALNHASLPSSFGEVKQKPTGPMILKRKSDGKMVKLVCPDCGRSDFGSAQGFINHCRIGHQRNFASHDAAAEGCGEPIEVDESGVIKGVSTETPTPTPRPRPTVTSLNSSVHPLVRSAHLVPKEISAKPLVKGGALSASERKVLKAKRKSFQALPQCSQTPHLSALVQGRGMTMDLRDMVNDAKTKVELPAADVEEDDEMEVDSPLPLSTGSGRHPQVAGKTQLSKSTNSAHRGAGGKSTIPQARPRERSIGSFASINTAADDSHLHGFIGLLPSPTNDSTQAPSLIDDDEEMEPQSPASSDEIDENDVHFQVRDDEHPEEANDLRGHEMPPPTTCAAPSAPTQTAITNPAPYSRTFNSKGDRHTNFVGENTSTENQNDRKRRRIGE